MAKIGLINMTNSITGWTNAAGNEMMSLRRMMEAMGHEVEIISRKNIPEENIIEFAEADINKYEKLMVVPGNINFFGGVPNDNILNAYELVAKFDGILNVILTDAKIGLQQLWPSIKNRFEKEAWKDVDLTEEDVKLTQPVNVISLNSDFDWVRKKQISDTLEIIDIHHHDFDKFALWLNMFKEFPKVEKTCDLIYGGSFRSGMRLDKMEDFLFNLGEDIKVETYGTLKEKQFKDEYEQKPEFGKKVKGDQVINNNSRGLATVVLGEANVDNKMTTARVWESMLSQAVCFIDNDYDPDHKIIDTEFNYVYNKEDLIEKIKKLKEDPEFAEKVVRHQHEHMRKFDYKSWLKEFDKHVK